MVSRTKQELCLEDVLWLEPEDGEDGWLRHLEKEQGPRETKTALQEGREPRKVEKDGLAIGEFTRVRGVTFLTP